MLIKKLWLANFRNYENQEFSPAKGSSILLGANAQVKTGLLEAIYLIATSKSHRTSKDSDLIRLGQGFCRVTAEVEREERSDVLLEVTIRRGEKKMVRINRTKRARIADLVGQLNAVIFSGYDIEMVKGDPSARRRFLNLEISQISPQYIYTYGRYKRVLDQRNGLLKAYKNRQVNLEELSALDEQLITYGAALMERRMQFTRRLSELAGAIYSEITESRESLSVEYEPSFEIGEAAGIEQIRETFERTVQSARNQELARGVTLWGPQRDDICFRVNGVDARSFGSEGQQRTAALSAKLAEVSLVEETTGEAPVVLLDDAPCELDEHRRAHIFDFTFGRCQTIMTATDLTVLPAKIVEGSAIYDVVSGEVRPR